MNITIIGDGGWGTAIGLLLNTYGHDVTVWGPFEDYLEEIRSCHENTRFLPGIPLPATLRWTSDPADAVAGTNAVVLATPSKFYADVCGRFKGLIPAHALVISLTKGLCEATHCRMSELAQDILGLDTIAVLSGPSHAEEVARKIPTAVVAASEDEAVALRVQQLFSGPLFRVYTSTDPLGVEIGGAVKNVIAIASGVCDGLGLGLSARAAMMTRGLVEMRRLGMSLGANPHTFSGLAGVGDLILTCTGSLSRNYTVGKKLGEGLSIDDILASMRMVAEGVKTAKSVFNLSTKRGVEMPICHEVYRILYEGLPPGEAVLRLMTRSLRQELDDEVIAY